MPHSWWLYPRVHLSQLELVQSNEYSRNVKMASFFFCFKNCVFPIKKVKFVGEPLWVILGCFELTFPDSTKLPFLPFYVPVIWMGLVICSVNKFFFSLAFNQFFILNFVNRLFCHIAQASKSIKRYIVKQFLPIPNLSQQITHYIIYHFKEFFKRTEIRIFFSSLFNGLYTDVSFFFFTAA